MSTATVTVVSELERAAESGVAVIVTTTAGTLFGPDGTFGVGSITDTVLTLAGDKGREARVPLASIASVIVTAIAPIRKSTGRMR